MHVFINLSIKFLGDKNVHTRCLEDDRTCVRLVCVKGRCSKQAVNIDQEDRRRGARVSGKSCSERTLLKLSGGF